MEKRKQTGKIFAAAGLGLVAMLVCLGLLSATLAKYTTTETMQDNARVAVFDVSVGDGDGEFALFETILDSDGGEESDVLKAGTGETAIIAPGTRGSFDLVLNNDSEVNVEYTVELETSTTDIPLSFRATGGSWTSNLNGALASSPLLAMNTSDTVTVEWMWDFEGDDVKDTSLGTAAPENRAHVTATAKVVFTQVD